MPLENESSAAASTESASTSTPVDTASIAAEVINDQQSADQGTTAPAQSGQVPAKADVDPDDFDAVEAERTDSLGRTRENAIPHSRVKAMIAKREAKLIATVAKELGITKAEAELKLEDITGELGTRKTKYTELEDTLGLTRQIEQIMETDGDRFIQMLAATDPQRYGKFLKVLEQGGTPAQAAQAAVEDAEPEPDYDMGNGQWTFSVEGLKKRDAWREKQIEKRILGQVNEKLTPFENERKQTQERARLQKIHDDARTAIVAKLDRASKWPNWKQYEPEIAKLIEGNPQLELEDAYMQVAMTQLTPNRTKMREELLAEINGQPRSTSVAAAPTAAAKTGETKSTADIAREVMEQMTKAA